MGVLCDDRRIVQKLEDFTNAIEGLRNVEQSRLVVEMNENNKDEARIPS